jgi:hypothetical protein
MHRMIDAPGITQVALGLPERGPEVAVASSLDSPP